jgi:broad specificity phosphatase PhoE
MIIKLVRHGQSQANVNEVDSTHMGDHNVHLTQTGIRQAELAGHRILTRDCYFFDDALLYQSPYTRTRETMTHLLSACPPGTLTRVYEDPRLREVEWGYDKPEGHGDYVDEMRETHGKFYYRIEGGESPADCFDRISTFLETLMRQIQRKKAERILIVSHGLTIRCFVMRFMHLTIEQFDEIKNPKNCDIVTITNETIAGQFSCRQWRVQGLRLPHDPQDRAYPWRCPMCKHDQVWPHSEHDAYDARCSMCENCGEKLFSA